MNLDLLLRSDAQAGLIKATTWHKTNDQLMNPLPGPWTVLENHTGSATIPDITLIRHFNHQLKES